MNKIALALVAFAALTGSAYAGDFDHADREAWLATVRSQSIEAAPVIAEGRNAATSVPMLGNVEPYIEQSIEQDARSSR